MSGYPGIGRSLLEFWLLSSGSWLMGSWRNSTEFLAAWLLRRSAVLRNAAVFTFSAAYNKQFSPRFYIIFVSRIRQHNLISRKSLLMMPRTNCILGSGLNTLHYVVFKRKAFVGLCGLELSLVGDYIRKYYYSYYCNSTKY